MGESVLVDVLGRAGSSIKLSTGKWIAVERCERECLSRACLGKMIAVPSQVHRLSLCLSRACISQVNRRDSFIPEEENSNSLSLRLEDIYRTCSGVRYVMVHGSNKHDQLVALVDRDRGSMRDTEAAVLGRCEGGLCFLIFEATAIVLLDRSRTDPESTTQKGPFRLFRLRAEVQKRFLFVAFNPTIMFSRQAQDKHRKS